MAMLFGGILYVFVMWVYQEFVAKVTLSAEQYVLEFGYIAALAAVAFLSSGLPDFNALLTQVIGILPDPSTTLAIITTLAALLYKTYITPAAISASTTTPAAAQAATAVATTTAAPSTGTTITVTGPWDGNVKVESRTGTRILVNAQGAWQLINDNIAANYIVGGGGINSLAPPSPWTWTGNLSLVTWGATLY